MRVENVRAKIYYYHKTNGVTIALVYFLNKSTS